MKENPQKIPLAERMRPRTLDEFFGQEHLIGKGKILNTILENQHPVSIIFWGPPGSGKTTLARILAEKFKCPSVFFSAVLSGIKEVKEVMEEAKNHKKLFGKSTIVFIDEIHRFNKAQQDAFLPYVERGDIILYGSTTENPSFEIISPLLSRVKVLVLHPLSSENLIKIIEKALKDKERGLGNYNLQIDKGALEMIVIYSNGDARRALNTLEIASELTLHNKKTKITAEEVKEALQKRILLYDKKGEEHYNLISALHKSLRNSDVDASLYWLARMIAGGEDPLYIARRLVRFAIEDIGLADPRALSIALWAKEAYDFLGSPEGELALAEAVVYLASAPKSNSVYKAFSKVMKDAEETQYEPVPLHLRNPETPLMKELGYGKDYLYAHNFKEKTTPMESMPKRLINRKYYEPGDLGLEKEIKKRIEYWNKLKEEMKKRLIEEGKKG
ncbi:replication-associated recombination protein A [Candidatus Aminicenantes bacterium AC-335-B20]|jgi:putative ATPase|nr:replication-associated recombination protein A [SCandidatus Aminicenantes bacterium Aminicenantia_JdfR_composite]MCP2599193.1 replication-associated recombination protein A [Candidatus Aminicenantes bacterium AC-335-B20]